MIPKSGSYAILNLLVFGIFLCTRLSHAQLASYPENHPANFTADFNWDKAFDDNDQRVGRLAAHSNKTAGSNIKIFWWNIQYGGTNSYYHQLNGTTPLSQNIQRLVTHKEIEPDIIALGEFKYDALSRKTLGLLRSRYQVEHFTPYDPKKPEIGFIIFSKYPVVSNGFSEKELDWTPLDMTDEEEKNNYRASYLSKFSEADHFMRTYLRYRFDVDGKSLNLTPVHLLSPWSVIQKEVGTGRTIKQIVFGEDNPLMYQMKRLRSYLNHDYSDSIDLDPMVIIGDFNVPRGYLITSAGYDLISKKMTNAFGRGGSGTFPAESAPDKPKMPRVQIDHAFVSKGISVKAAEVLGFRGSDHYPIYIVIDRK